MSIIELPGSRVRGQATHRVALRSGVAGPPPVMRVVKAPELPALEIRYCDRCASPVEFGAVTNGLGTYCSVECSLDGPGRSA